MSNKDVETLSLHFETLMEQFEHYVHRMEAGIERIHKMCENIDRVIEERKMQTSTFFDTKDSSDFRDTISAPYIGDLGEDLPSNSELS